ncbi:ShlB/FhaC/HecB family hemolysin secretion/activation protein [Pseudanabaena sp. FACHB-1998]|uniref:ShlB/FhaC/HecB family hemolysin secretion/activation protein n=1 Tax=Pseudanabaena sp. FACHB-1998 TaxID=2692858 RepID=UPI001680ABD0|nr:ShlB/FhaC/HecB family hemolysin secretion/activation protein [Pseudanabaena sp. FACHB-1998]MBD2177926.1 ShlB/FhaC/HecB family hemolysin secretion/activation protein [Pseudanabaena sp. FACHB-1998]
MRECISKERILSNHLGLRYILNLKRLGLALGLSIATFTGYNVSSLSANPILRSSLKELDSKTKQLNGKTDLTTQEVLIPVKQIRVVGSSILTTAEISKITDPYLNKSLTFNQLREIADKVTEFYQERNYITSRAIIEAQDIKDGVVTIKVLEGSLERIDIKRAGDAEGRLNYDYVRSRASLAANIPLNFTRLEEELQLLRSDPLLSDIRANLTAGSNPDQSVLQITFSEAKTFNTRLFTDNYGNVSSGIYRAGISVQEANLTGIGDSASISYLRSGSSNTYGIGYQYPLNPTGGTLSFSASIGDSRVTQPEFASLNIATDSKVYELSYRQPLIRNPREELAVGIGISFEDSASSFDGKSFNFQNLAFDDGRSQARVLKLSQEYVNRDTSGAWAFRSSFNAGLNILGATIRNDGSPDGRFLYWTGQALRVQRLGNDRDTLAFFRLNMQLTGDRLLSLNRFSVGGPQSVRGYRQNQTTGDSGIQGSIEVQLPIVRNEDGFPIVKLLPFVEGGTIWNTRTTNPSPQTLFGLGLGAQYQPFRNLIFRIDYGIPLVNANNSGSNLQDSGLYFSINGNF